MRELLSIVTIDLLASGNETTTAALASGLRLLIEDPEPIARIERDRELLEPLAEEIVRLESPAQEMFRRVTADTVLAGTISGSRPTGLRPGACRASSAATCGNST